MDIEYKCGYCKWRLKYDQLEQHSCFVNKNVESLVMDNEGTVFMSENETETAIDTCDKDRLDEDLITAVKNRPALYDFRLPLKVRGRKQKDVLWNEVSVCLKGLYTPNEAEKRWNYLKNSYRKARNVYKKRLATEQRSGAASASEAIVPSFRHYDVMTFLNDTLEYRQTYDMLKISLLSKIKEWKSNVQLNWRKEIQRKELIKAILIYKCLKRKIRKSRRQKIWVRPIFSENKRCQQGDSNNLIKEMMNSDTDKYLEYLRMDSDAFSEILKLVAPSFTKQTVVRTPIPASTRLEICLRYLASGDSMHSISYAFRVGLNTVSNIVSETCQAIWNNLKDKVFPQNAENIWLEKANEFEKLWDFPNCIGAIDGSTS